MILKLKKGSILGFILLLAILVAAFGFGAFYAVGKLGLLPASTSSTGKKLDKASVMRSVGFKDSKGQKKKFVVVKKTEATGIPVADAYITDDKLTLASAIKIEGLSNDSSLGYAASGINALGTMLTISTSPGNTKRVILVSISVGDASTITLVDEEGRIITQEVVANLLVNLEGKCQCQFVFDSWKSSDSFYLKVPANDSNTYKILVSAKDGTLEGDIKKI